MALSSCVSTAFPSSKAADMGSVPEVALANFATQTRRACVSFAAAGCICSRRVFVDLGFQDRRQRLLAFVVDQF